MIDKNILITENRLEKVYNEISYLCERNAVLRDKIGEKIDEEVNEKLDKEFSSVGKKYARLQRHWLRLVFKYFNIKEKVDADMAFIAIIYFRKVKYPPKREGLFNYRLVKLDTEENLLGWYPWLKKIPMDFILESKVGDDEIGV